jgi:methylenetetrahydrofolate--tRNA-(uracil-5-)-methyltransferase
VKRSQHSRRHGGPVILAAGPLLSGPLAEHLRSLTGDAHLAFYDAIAPIVDADSLDCEVIYRKSRWDDAGPGDYLNCPMDREQYERFHFPARIGWDRSPARL